jgi:HPt (histidine-containing phosphotransfer) domain-containing protein
MTSLIRVGPEESERANVLPVLTVRVDKDLETLVNKFLARKRDDLDCVRTALAARDFETIRRIGHDLKGAGEGFGFPELSAFGAALERAAIARNERALTEQLAAVEQFLSRLRVTFR